MRATILFTLAVVAALAACTARPDAGVPALTAVPGAVQRGEALVRARCAVCHAVGPTGDSPMAEAPPFRDLHTRYPVRFLQEALAEGLTTAHPAMPPVELAPDEIRDLIAYLESLETG
ncbi:c-type cytochrome [Brevundimonas sp.]|uniref:c-type cytochrome n=1 Tax=Brevundimonas sp. TaxID=1871086 RepID=UPI003AF71CC0